MRDLQRERFCLLLKKRGVLSEIKNERILAALYGAEHPAILFHNSIIAGLKISNKELKWLLE